MCLLSASTRLELISLVLLQQVVERTIAISTVQVVAATNVLAIDEHVGHGALTGDGLQGCLVLTALGVLIEFNGVVGLRHVV